MNYGTVILPAREAMAAGAVHELWKEDLLEGDCFKELVDLVTRGVQGQLPRAFRVTKGSASLMFKLTQMIVERFPLLEQGHHLSVSIGPDAVNSHQITLKLQKIPMPSRS